MKAKIGIKEEDLVKIAEILDKLLADEQVLYIKTRNAHWNIEGPDFHTAHVYLESLYNELAIHIDSIAERSRSLGHYAVGKFKQYLELTRLSEMQTEKNDSLSYYKELLSDHESIAMSLRADIEIISETNDAGTEDFLTSLLEYHEKTAWMLRSRLG